MLFLYLSVTLMFLGSKILDLFWASNCNPAINMKLFLFFFIYSILVRNKR